MLLSWKMVCISIYGFKFLNMRRTDIGRGQYKMVIYLLKLLPVLAAVSCFLNTAFSFWKIDISEISYISGLSLLPLFFFWFSSYVFRFCEYYRLPIYYVFINNTICWIDYFYGIPIDDFSMFFVHMLVALVCILIFLFLKIKKI